MDLSDISYKQAISDTNLANRRVIDLSLKLQAAARELDNLRRELESLSTEIHIQLENISGIVGADISAPVTISADEELHFKGWIVSKKVVQRLSKVVVVLLGAKADTGGSVVPTIQAGCDVIERHDVAQHFKNPDMLRSGFEIAIGPRQVPPGMFEARLDVHTEEGRVLTKSLGHIKIVSPLEIPADSSTDDRQVT